MFRLDGESRPYGARKKRESSRVTYRAGDDGGGGGGARDRDREQLLIPSSSSSSGNDDDDGDDDGARDRDQEPTPHPFFFLLFFASRNKTKGAVRFANLKIRDKETKRKAVVGWK